MSACLVASSARHRLEAVAHGQVVVRAAGPLADDHRAAAVAQVLGLGVPLGAVAEDGDRLALEDARGRRRCRSRSWRAWGGDVGGEIVRWSRFGDQAQIDSRTDVFVFDVHVVYCCGFFWSWLACRRGPWRCGRCGPARRCRRAASAR